MIGSTISHYTIEALLGQGGMGTVYLARDTWLGRTVAIKVLSSSAGDESGSARMLREAKAASSLNHPNIVTIHEFDRSGDLDLIVMELVDGQPLSDCIGPDGLPIDRILDYACQIASALAAAHDAGIVHRDIKPGNVMVTRDGRIKVLDFGLARRSLSQTADALTASVDSRVTEHGVVVGSIGYMAPEQIEGKPADARSDVFSFGVVLFELLTGRRLFEGDSKMTILAATLQGKVPSRSEFRSDTPRDLRQVVRRCLARSPDERYASARELANTLEAIRTRLSPATAGRRLVRRLAILAFAVVLCLAAGTIGWLWRKQSRLRWVTTVAVPEIRRLDGRGNLYEAFVLARRAREIAPDDPQLSQEWLNITGEDDFHTEPEGAELSVGPYGSDRSEWYVLGTTPLAHVRTPFADVRWRATKPGYETLEGAAAPSRLIRSGSRPEGTVFVTGGQWDFGRGPVELPDYWIDRFEVTNRQFKEFISHGGYSRQELWNEPFFKEGGTVSWIDAMSQFRDRTGRPGPSTWELGTFPEGQADYPVSGVSWYEAMAYARYAGKMLPTVYHWYNASGASFSGTFEVVQASNFSGQGPARVGQYRGLGLAGTYDMAGNVKEWRVNGTSTGLRYILGGAWYDAGYEFHYPDAQAPFARRPGFGFRCVKQDVALTKALTDTVTLEFTGPPVRAKPVTDDVFKIYLRQFEYDHTPLHLTTESVDDGNPQWKRERVSFDAAYGKERVPVFLYLPTSSRPPFETVIFFPAANARYQHSSQTLWLRFADFLVTTGRALVYPVYKGTYERQVRPNLGPNELRDLITQQGKDLRRTIDYLETRHDIDVSHLAYEGLSSGAALAPLWLTAEPRLRVGVLLGGGLVSKLDYEWPPWPAEIDHASYATRVTVPILMINGRSDFILPYEQSQLPLFRALATPAPDKRHVLVDGDHFPSSPQQAMKEILDWLDKYQGPVHPREK